MTVDGRQPLLVVLPRANTRTFLLAGDGIRPPGPPATDRQFRLFLSKVEQQAVASTACWLHSPCAKSKRAGCSRTVSPCSAATARAKPTLSPVRNKPLTRYLAVAAPPISTIGVRL